MKTFNTTLLILFCFVYTTSIAQNQDRDVVFAHGQGGNGPNNVGAGGTWEIYDDIFSGERQMNAIRDNWQERNGIGNYGNQIGNSITNQSTTPPNSALRDLPLGIGHSNGGLGLRSLIHLPAGADRILGGVVTVGTPHRGGAIVNNIQNGSVQSALNRGCRALGAGPSTHLGGGFIVQGITTNALCTALPTIFEIFTGGTLEGSIQDQSALDAAVDSDFLSTLNNFEPNVNIISVYGNEESPVHWRLLSSQDTDNENDQRYVNVSNILQGLYTGASVTYGVLATVRLVGGFFSFNPVAVAKGAYNVFQSVQYARGALWLANSEQYWLDAIDCESTTTYTQTFTTSSIPCTNFSVGTDEWFQCMDEYIAAGDSAPTGTTTRTIRVTVNAASDGFFCIDTQIYDPFDSNRNYEAEGVNHSDETNTTFMQTRNSNDEIREIFDEIFNRIDEFQIQPL